MKFQSLQRGNTFLGLVIGMIIGLAVAVAVALFITRAPVPFVDRAGPKASTTAPAQNGGVLPDPNKSLYGKEPAKAAVPATPTPAPAAAADQPFSLYNLLPGKSAPSSAVPDPVKGTVKSDPAKEADDGKTRYLLQVGAYENEAEADAVRAKLALMGFEANISKRERDGKVLHRVRIGPINQLEEMNRIRAALSQNGMQPSVIRLPAG